MESMHDYDPQYQPNEYRMWMHRSAAAVFVIGTWLILLVMLALTVGGSGVLVGFFVGGFLAIVGGIYITKWLNARHARREYHRAQRRAAKAAEPHDAGLWM